MQITRLHLPINSIDFPFLQDETVIPTSTTACPIRAGMGGSAWTRLTDTDASARWDLLDTNVRYVVFINKLCCEFLILI